MAEAKFFYMRQGQGQELGPVSGGHLKSLAGCGRLRPDDLVWQEGSSSRVPAGRVKGLFPPPPQARPCEPPAGPGPSSHGQPPAAATPVTPTPAAASPCANDPPASQRPDFAAVSATIKSFANGAFANAKARVRAQTAGYRAASGSTRPTQNFLAHRWSGLSPTARRATIAVGAILIAVALMKISASIPKHEEAHEEVAVDGVAGAIAHKTLSTLSPHTTGWNVAERVYGIAKEYTQLKSVTVKLFLVVPGGLVDKYGKNVGSEVEMGTVTVSDLDEVRRYVDDNSYAYRNADWYAARITALPYSRLMRGE